MKKMYFFVALLSLALAGELSAQQVRIDSGPLVDRLKETVYTLNGYISDMVGECPDQDRFNCNQNRNRSKKAALILFVGGGESYEVDGVHKDPVRMETTFISPSGAKSIKSQFMKVYFDKLIGLVTGVPPKYTKVTITSSELGEIQLGNLHQINDNLYECIATFYQCFYGERGEVVVYKDYTEKKVKCYVKVVPTPTGREFETLLGDTKCGESHRL